MKDSFESELHFEVYVKVTSESADYNDFTYRHSFNIEHFFTSTIYFLV